MLEVPKKRGSVHYHMLYVPFFLAGGAVGLMSLKHFLVRYSPDKAKTIIATFLAVIGIWNYNTQPSSQFWSSAHKAINPYEKYIKAQIILMKLQAYWATLKQEEAFRFSAFIRNALLVKISNISFSAFPAGILRLITLSPGMLLAATKEY